MICYRYFTVSLARHERWMEYATDGGMYIDSRGLLYMWAAIPQHLKALAETN